MKNYRNYCSSQELKDILKKVKKSGRKLLVDNKKIINCNQQFKIVDSQLANGEIITAIVYNLNGQGSQELHIIFDKNDLRSFYGHINQLWRYSEWNTFRKEEFMKMAKAVRYNFFAFPEESIRKHIEENVIQKIIIGKCEIKEDDQLILEVENWEVDGCSLPFLGKKKIGEKFKCWGRFLMKDEDSILVGNGSGLHNSRCYIPLSKIKSVKIVSLKKSCPKGVLFLP